MISKKNKYESRLHCQPILNRYINLLFNSKLLFLRNFSAISLDFLSFTQIKNRCRRGTQRVVALKKREMCGEGARFGGTFGVEVGLAMWGEMRILHVKSYRRVVGPTVPSFKTLKAYLKTSLTGHFETRSKNYLCFFLFRFRLKNCFLNLIS